MVPSTRRPTIAMPVVTATAMPAGLRPMVGSRKAIWCTRKPACAVMAQRERRRHAPEVPAPQRRGPGPFRRRQRRVRRFVRNPALRRPRQGRAQHGQRQRHRQRQDHGRAHQHGGGEARGPRQEHQRRHDGDAAEARPVERQRDGKPAPLPEPQPENDVDGAEAHGGPGKGHHEIGRKRAARAQPRTAAPPPSRQATRRPAARKRAIPKRRIASSMNTTSSALRR